MSSSSPEVVIITGALAGIGRATARAFAKQGAYIGLVARSRDGLEGARQEVEAAGGKALVLPTDVSDPDQVEAAAAAVEQEFGRIDSWVNNAMASILSPYQDWLVLALGAGIACVALGAYLGTQTQSRQPITLEDNQDKITLSDIRSEVIHQINRVSNSDRFQLFTTLA